MKTKLKELRIEWGLTQQQIADEINCTRQAYNRYELGEREPDYDILITLAKFYGVSTDFILGLSDKVIYIRPNLKIEEIKEYLKVNKITYKELSDKSGIPESTLKNLFSGATTNPRIATMRAIEQALGLTLQYANIVAPEQLTTIRMTGKDLNNIRKQKKISFEQLSELSGIPKSTIEKVLLEITPHPRIDTIEAIESALEIQRQSISPISSDKITELDLPLYKRIKKEKKMTIADIAAAANLPKGTVQNIFCGYIPHPRIDTIKAIEYALGIEKPQTEFVLCDTESLKDLSDEDLQLIRSTLKTLVTELKERKKK